MLNLSYSDFTFIVLSVVYMLYVLRMESLYNEDNKMQFYNFQVNMSNFLRIKYEKKRRYNNKVT